MLLSRQAVGLAAACVVTIVNVVAAFAQVADPPPAPDDFSPPLGAEAEGEVDGTERPWFALGASRALSGIAGPAAIVRVTDGMDLDALVGVARFSADPGEPSSALGLIVGVRQTLTRRGPAALSIGGRLGLSHVGAAGGADSSTTWLIEAPARIELTATPWLRLHVEGGVALAMEAGSDGMGEVPASDGEVRWSLGAAGLAAGAGFALGF